MSEAAASELGLLQEIRDELRALRLATERLADQPAPDETVDVDGAAALLHTTKRAIYERRRVGGMPTPISRRPLVWRKADLLAPPKR